MILVFREALRGDPGDQVTPTAAAEPTDGSTAASEPTAAVDAIAAACGPAPATPIAVGDLPVGCATTAPLMDRNFAEWDELPSITVTDQVAPAGVPNAGDLGAIWQGTWDQDALYLHAQVADPAVREVDVTQPSQFWRGDSISFEFGPDPRGLGAGDPVRDGLDRHVMIGVTADGAAAAVNVAARSNFPAGQAEPAITTAAVRTDYGYEIEVRIPWVALGVGRPSRGDVFAANLNVSDAAISREWVLGRMISSNLDRTGANQLHPGTWQWLVLEDTA